MSKSPYFALSVLLLAGGSLGCGPDEGKNTVQGDGASGTGGAGGTASPDGGTVDGGTVIEDPNFTLGEPQTLASSQPVPIRLVLLGDNVYFVNRGHDYQATGSVLSVPKAGGSVSVLASELAYATGLTLMGEDTLVYTTFGLMDTSPREGSIVLHSPGGSPQILFPVDYPFEPWWSGDSLYLFSSSALIQAPLGEPSTTLATLNRPHRFWADGGTFYITEGGDDVPGALRVWSDSQPDAPVLNDTVARPEGIVMANGRLYVTSSRDGSVVSVDPTSGAAQTVASGYGAPWGMVADSANLYVADRGTVNACVAGENKGAIIRIPLDGGDPESLATGLPCPSSLAVDATGVYWVDNGTTADAADGAVMKIAKIRG